MKMPSTAQVEKKLLYIVLDTDTSKNQGDYADLPTIMEKGKDLEQRLVFSYREAFAHAKRVPYSDEDIQVFRLKVVDAPIKTQEKALFVVLDLDMSWHNEPDEYSTPEEHKAYVTPSLISTKEHDRFDSWQRYLFSYEEAKRLKDTKYGSEHLRVCQLIHTQPSK